VANVIVAMHNIPISVDTLYHHLC